MIIETKAPISIEDLKKYFTDKDITYLIDYSKSELKGKKLITYLSNLDIPADIKNVDLDLVKDYLNSVSLVSISSLENVVIDILFVLKGLKKDKQYDKFISENFEILDKWQNKLESLSVYNMYMLNSDHFRDYAKSFPKDETRDLEGVNFVSILKHNRFFSFFGKINNDKLKFYTHYFDGYIFRGKNLFEYWANDKNPLFLLTWSIANGRGKEYIEARKLTLKSINK
jgi:hypothetical protein